MSRRMRTYFYAVLGAIGGLIGWQVSDMLGLSFSSNLYISEVLVGALVGLCIGLFIGITEGAMTRNIVQAVKSGLFSGLLGLLAGGIGLPLSEFLFQSVGAGYLGRALGWAVFGMLIGLAEGVFGKTQIIHEQPGLNRVARLQGRTTPRAVKAVDRPREEWTEIPVPAIVDEDQLSLAIGRNGQNVRLASQLTGWDIDILTEAEESERRAEEFKNRSQTFIDALDVDDVIAHLLVSEGFTTIEEVAFVPVDDLISIEGFDEEVSEELRARARAYLAEQTEQLTRRWKELGVSDEIAAIEKLTPAMVVKLGEAGVKTLDDLADLSSDELRETLGDIKLSAEDADAVIMAARAHWFPEEEAAPAEPAGTAAAAEPRAESVPAEPAS